MVVAAVECYKTSETTAAAKATSKTTTTPLENLNCSIDLNIALITAANPNDPQAASVGNNNNNQQQQQQQQTDDNANNNNIKSDSNGTNMSDIIDETKTTAIATASVAGDTSADDDAVTSKNPIASTDAPEVAATKSAVSQRNVDIKIDKTTNMEVATQQLTKKVLKLDLGGKNLDEYSLKSPKSPIAARLPHQTSLTSSVDVEDRKTLREALYQGIFHRHRRTIFAVGSFLRMLRSRNSQYNTIRSSSEGEDIDEASTQLRKKP